MNEQERVNHRHITNRKLLAAGIGSIRGVQKDIDKFGFEFSNQRGGLIQYQKELRVAVNKLWIERKKNKWTN